MISNGRYKQAEQLSKQEPFGMAYIDGPNLQEFAGGAPAGQVDPSGLTWYKPWTWFDSEAEAAGNVIGQAKKGMNRGAARYP